MAGPAAVVEAQALGTTSFETSAGRTAGASVLPNVVDAYSWYSYNVIYLKCTSKSNW